MISTQTGNLPSELTTLIGRRQEVAEVRRLFADGRLVTLTGTGGVGKTRIALRAATETRRSFADGVWFVELSGLQDPELIAHAVGEAVGLRDQTVRPQSEVLAEFLAGKQTLLVLDTCEHLVEACAELVSALLGIGPKVRILATSRQPLRIPGERQLVVEAPPAEHAISLFYERATAVDPRFTCDHDLAVRLCERLDNIPLAIELAAVRLRTLTPEQLLVRLDDRFRVLERPGRPGARHQALRTTVGWSHELCEPSEKLLWARLSVFANDFDLEAAEYVCSGSALPAGRVLDALTGLVDKSIVIRVPGTSRFRMLDTIREYGEDWLVNLGEDLTLLCRHRDYYLRLAIKFDEEWGGPDQYAWFDRMQAESGNLRAALDFSLSEPGEEELGRELAVRLRYFWVGCGGVREGAYFLDKALAHEDDTEALAVRLWMSAFLGSLTTADAFRCWMSAEGTGDRDLMAWAALAAGNAGIRSGDLDEAVRWHGEAARLLRGVEPWRPVMGIALVAQGLSLTLRGEPDKALPILDELNALTERYGDAWTRSYGDYVRGKAELAMGRPQQAAASIEAALVVKQRLRDNAGTALCIDALATVASTCGDGIRAARLLGVAGRYFRSFGRHGSSSPAMVAARKACEAATVELIGRERFQAEFDRGFELPLDEVLGLAAAEAPPTRGNRPLLTPRQQQIAELVAAGLSNREIAERLTIAKRTVDSHVEHILNKLGFGSRTQVAVWVTDARKPENR